MRTIRDAIGENRSINEKEMSEVINSYNNTPHKSLDNKAPNDMTEEDEINYIKSKSKSNPYKFDENERVRVVLAKEPFSKRRNKVSNVAYTIDSKSGNQFIIKSTDGSIDKLPGYRLIKTTNRNIPLAESLKDGKRGIIDKILEYNEKTDKYKVEYEGVNGPERYDTIPSKNLREGNPIKLSSLERQFWLKQKEIPVKIRKFI